MLSSEERVERLASQGLHPSEAVERLAARGVLPPPPMGESEALAAYPQC